MDGDKAGPLDPVISQSANVVVQRLDSEYPAWNLAASVGGRVPSTEGEPRVTYISANDQLSSLTPGQLQKIRVPLQVENPRKKRSSLTEGFETTETSQFTVVDVEQEEDDGNNYLGEVLQGELPPPPTEGEIPVRETHHQGEIPAAAPPAEDIPHTGELPPDETIPGVNLVGDTSQAESVPPIPEVVDPPISKVVVPPVSKVVESPVVKVVESPVSKVVESKPAIAIAETKSEGTISESTTAEESASKLPEGTGGQSAIQSATSKSEDSEESSTMVRTNLGKKITVRTRGKPAESETDGGVVSQEGSTTDGVGTKEAEGTPQGFVSHADHSYAGRGQPVQKDSQKDSQKDDPSATQQQAEPPQGSGNVETHGSKEAESAMSTPQRRSARERRSSAGKGGRHQEVEEEKRTTKRKSASGRQTADKKGRKSSKEAEKAGPSGVKRAPVEGSSSEGVSDSGRPRRSAGRNFKIEDLNLASSDEEKEDSDGDDAGEDGGSEWSEDEDPERLWCICRKPHDMRFMICCDKCEDWFHGSCVSVTKSQGKHMEDNGLEWFCPSCKGIPTTAAKMKTAGQPPPAKKGGRGAKGKGKGKAVAVKRERRNNSRSKKSETSTDEKSTSRRRSKGQEVKEEPPEKKEATQVGRRRTLSRERSKGHQEEVMEGHKDKSNEDKKVVPKVEHKKKPKEGHDEGLPEGHKRVKQLTGWLSKQSSRDGGHQEVKDEQVKKEEEVVGKVKEKAAEVKVEAEVRHSREADREDPEIVREKHGKSSPRAAAVPKSTPDHHKKGESSEPAPVKKKKIVKPPLPKQKCIMTNCDNIARPNTIYCSNRCILRHAVESLQLLHQEKWFSQGFKRDASGEVIGRAHCEGDRVPVVEKHTNRLRTGLAAPTPEDLPSWLERHPTYEVLVPTVKKTPPPALSPTSKHAKDSKDTPNRRNSRERLKSESQGKHSVDKLPVKQETPQKEPKKVDHEKPAERRKSSDHQLHHHHEGGRNHEGSRHQEGGSKQSEGARHENNKPSTQQSSAEGVRQNVRKALSECFCNRLKSAPEIKVTPEEATKTAHDIEGELFKLFKDTGIKYKAKYRTLIFNLRDVKNKGLFRRVVQRKIKPPKLVQMSSEDLASKELHEWREREAKHTLEMIVEVEKERKEVPIIIKTHKGEVELAEEEDLSTLQANTNRDSPIPPEIKSPIIAATTPAASSSSTAMAEPAVATAIVDTTDQHRSHLFDLNCKICTGRAAPPEETSAGAKKAKVKRQVSKAEELEREEREAQRIAAKLLEKRELAEKRGAKKKGLKGAGKKKPVAKVKEFVARTPPGTPPRTPPVAEKTQPKVVKSFWKGFLNMQDVAKFVAAAYHVSGPIDILNDLFPDSLEIRGRIPFTTVWDYFNKLQSAGSTEMTVLRFEIAHEEDKGLYGNLFNYFSSRERIGVIGFSKPLVKDFYILPLPSHNPIPSSILPFEGPGLPETRPHMLLGLIIIHKDKARAAQISPTHVQPRQQKAKSETTGKAAASSAGAKRTSTDQAKPERKRVTIREPEEEEKHYLPPVVKRIRSTDPDYVPEAQMAADPIVAQYGKDKMMSEEEVEPYSPSQEEREAPYDPTDVLDDLAAQQASAQGLPAGPQPGLEAGTATKSAAESEAYSPSHPTESVSFQSTSEEGPPPDVEKLNQLIQGVSGNVGGLGATEIASAADAASNVSENLLSSLGESDLSEQQQLLIQLTRQVEEAKKALLDKQIESLQTEISRATNQMATLQSTDSIGGPGVPFGGAGDEEAGVRKAPADSSTSGMTPVRGDMDQDMREGGPGPGPQDFYGPPGNQGFGGPNFNNPGPMGPNMPMQGPYPWPGPGMPPGMGGDPRAGPFPPPPGMMGPPGNMGPGWGPRGYNGP